MKPRYKLTPYGPVLVIKPRFSPMIFARLFQLYFKRMSTAKAVKRAWQVSRL